MFDINKFYENNLPEKIIKNDFQNKVFKYTAIKTEYPDKKKLKKSIKIKPKMNFQKQNNELEKNSEDLSDNEPFDYNYYKKYMKCRNILPLRTGLPCFITILNGDRLKNLINNHFLTNKTFKIKYIYETKNESEKKCLQCIKNIDGLLIHLLKCKEKSSYEINKKKLLIELENLYKMMTKIKKTTIKLTNLYSVLKKNIKIISNTKIKNFNKILGKIIDHFLDNWLFVEKIINSPKISKPTELMNNRWWKIIFNL